MFWFSGHEACGILAPQAGIEPVPPAFRTEVLTTGLPGKSPMVVLDLKKNFGCTIQYERS